MRPVRTGVSEKVRLCSGGSSLRSDRGHFVEPSERVVQSDDGVHGSSRVFPFRVRDRTFDSRETRLPLVEDCAEGEPEGPASEPFEMEVATSVGLEPVGSVPLLSISLERDAVRYDEILVVRKPTDALLGMNGVAGMTEAAADDGLLAGAGRELHLTDTRLQSSRRSSANSSDFCLRQVPLMYGGLKTGDGMFFLKAPDALPHRFHRSDEPRLLARSEAWVCPVVVDAPTGRVDRVAGTTGM
jgi:hypothetical protein